MITPAPSTPAQWDAAIEFVIVYYRETYGWDEQRVYDHWLDGMYLHRDEFTAAWARRWKRNDDLKRSQVALGTLTEKLNV